jgi:hypothetical protein
MYGIVGIKGAHRIDLVYMGYRLKVLTSKAEPQIEGILGIWKTVVYGRTKGLKILK